MKRIKWLSSSALFIIGVILTFYLEKIIEIDDQVFSLSYGLFIGGILFFMSIIVWLVMNNIQSQQELEKANKKVKNYKIEIAKLNNSSLLNTDQGTVNLLMALSQDTFEPLKFELLRRAATDYNNILAAVILAGFYQSGLKKNENTVLEKNSDIALSLYKSVNDCDTFGITDWLIGFSYENNQTLESSQMTEGDRKKRALYYYKKSADKGFPKAENSIGKFNHKGWVTGQPNETEAIGHFKKAANAGDIYALMNCGHSEMKRYFNNMDIASLYNAQDYFAQASAYDNSEAWLWLGIVCEERGEKEPDKKDELLRSAKENYLKSFCHTENKYSATGLFRLGCLIQSYSFLEKDAEIIAALKAKKTDNLAIKCFSNAYSLFHILYDQNNIQVDRYKKYYDDLKACFRNIKVTFEQDYI